LVKQKGFDVLIKAFAKADIASHDLLLAGEGSERQALEQLVESLNLKDRALFLGRADRPTAVSLFKGCSFFVLPSRHEPQGIVNLEAMAAGKAVIASRVGGVPEIVLDGETGILVAGEDDAELATALTRLGNNETLRQKLGDAGQRRSQEFSWSAIADQYIDIYRKVMAPDRQIHV
jgi:starch synthase